MMEHANGICLRNEQRNIRRSLKVCCIVWSPPLIRAVEAGVHRLQRAHSLACNEPCRQRIAGGRKETVAKGWGSKERAGRAGEKGEGDRGVHLMRASRRDATRRACACHACTATLQPCVVARELCWWWLRGMGEAWAGKRGIHRRWGGHTTLS